MLNYEVIKESFKSDELGEYESFSISAKYVNKQIAYIPDVFTDYKEAKEFAELFTKMQLAPEHLFDVVCDMIGTT